MNEYKKKFAEQAGQVNRERQPEQQQMTNGIPNSVLNDVFAGKKHATSEMMGHRQNLAESVQAKMSAAFGMDFSQLKFYRSDAMSGTDMKGMSQGDTVVLSSDVDLNTGEGQAVLGHELSHIHAQATGIGMGHAGLYNNASLEQQADREGILAARGRPIYEQSMSGNPGMSYGLGMKGVEGLTPLSGGISASAGAPMQAKKDGEDDSRAYFMDELNRVIEKGPQSDTHSEPNYWEKQIHGNHKTIRAMMNEEENSKEEKQWLQEQYGALMDELPDLPDNIVRVNRQRALLGEFYKMHNKKNKKDGGSAKPVVSDKPVVSNEPVKTVDELMKAIKRMNQNDEKSVENDGDLLKTGEIGENEIRKILDKKKKREKWLETHENGLGFDPFFDD